MLLFGFILKRLLSYLSQILTSSQDFRQFLTYKSIFCIIFGYTFSDFWNNHQRLIVKVGKKLNIPTKFEKNRTKPGNPYFLVLFENRTKPGTVLSETVLSGDPLY